MSVVVKVDGVQVGAAAEGTINFDNTGTHVVVAGTDSPAGTAKMTLTHDGTARAHSVGNYDYLGNLICPSEALLKRVPTSGSAVQLYSTLRGVCYGRLTLTSGTAVTSADVTGAGTLYFTPYRGGHIALYDGVAWLVYAFTEASLALTLTSGKNYDVFAYYDSASSSVKLELSAAWTNDSTRADSLTTQDGVYVKSSDPTRRYLGTIRASGSNTTEDSAVKRFVWNYYNRVPRFLRRLESTDSWTYTTSSFRQANASSSNQVEAVIGMSESKLHLQVFGWASTNSAGLNVSVAIGEDSTSAAASGNIGMRTGLPSTAGGYQVAASLAKYPAAGYHYWAWLESGGGAGITTWYGDAGAVGIQSGLSGWVIG